MACTKIIGLNKTQKKELDEMIRAISGEDAPKEDYSISIAPIMLHRQNSLWYEGGVASIFYKGFTFSVDAAGDLKATLFNAATDKELVFINHKTSNRIFYNKMRPYLKSDLELERAISENHEKYRLHIEDGTWWEVFVFDKDNEMLSETWVVDADNILPAVVETLSKMDGYLEKICSNG